MSDTRLFYVTDSVESNEEIFETYEEAMSHFWRLVNDGQELPRLRVCEVVRAFKENGVWNYDDQADTFTTVKVFPIDVAANRAEMLQEKADEARQALKEEGL